MDELHSILEEPEEWSGRHCNNNMSTFTHTVASGATTHSNSKLATSHNSFTHLHSVRLVVRALAQKQFEEFLIEEMRDEF